MKLFRVVGGWFADYPPFVSLLIIALVVAHFLVAQEIPEINIPAVLAQSSVPEPRDTLTSLALGVAGVSAMVGGFAGVVVVFGLGSENDRFRLLRQSGGRRLRASWVSVVLSSFTGAFGAVIAAVIVVGFGVEPGMWVLEVCLLFAAHGAIRLTALLSGLAGIVDEEDKDADRRAKLVPKSRLIPKRGTRAEKIPAPPVSEG